jgi:hypothetical protein
MVEKESQRYRGKDDGWNENLFRISMLQGGYVGFMWKK